MSPTRSIEPWVLLTARLALGVLLLVSAYMKLKTGAIVDGPFAFALAVRSFEILPDALVPFAAFAVPWTEAVAGACLVLGLFARGAGTLSLALLITFTLAVVSVVLRGMNLSCGCFGEYKLICSGAAGWCKVGENMILIALAMLPAARGAGAVALDRWVSPAPALTRPSPATGG
ncbi:MAG: DoxX family membrane protein [Phycisphaeraceae bacterium]|nr:MAG: DoxX family membrane protein [Phycisphaeraceae bacterium]